MEGNEMSRLENTFRAPKGVSQFKTITVCELDGARETDAAHLADIRIAGMKLNPNDPTIGVTVFRIEREEDIRASIVAVNDVPVGFPFAEFDKWPKRVRQVVCSRFFDAMNSVDTIDLEKCVSEVMSPEPPRNEEETSGVVPIVARKGG
jgi:hypothetical protein